MSNFEFMETEFDFVVLQDKKEDGDPVDIEVHPTDAGYIFNVYFTDEDGKRELQKADVVIL